MDNDQKFICFLFGSVVTIILTFGCYAAFNTYLEHKMPIQKTDCSTRN